MAGAVEVVEVRLHHHGAEQLPAAAPNPRPPRRWPVLVLLAAVGVAAVGLGSLLAEEPPPEAGPVAAFEQALQLGDLRRATGLVAAADPLDIPSAVAAELAPDTRTSPLGYLVSFDLDQCQRGEGGLVACRFRAEDRFFQPALDLAGTIQFRLDDDGITAVTTAYSGAEPGHTWEQFEVWLGDMRPVALDHYLRSGPVDDAGWDQLRRLAGDYSTWTAGGVIEGPLSDAEPPTLEWAPVAAPGSAEPMWVQFGALVSHQGGFAAVGLIPEAGGPALFEQRVWRSADGLEWRGTGLAPEAVLPRLASTGEQLVASAGERIWIHEGQGWSETDLPVDDGVLVGVYGLSSFGGDLVAVADVAVRGRIGAGAWTWTEGTGPARVPHPPFGVAGWLDGAVYRPDAIFLPTPEGLVAFPSPAEVDRLWLLEDGTWMQPFERFTFGSGARVVDVAERDGRFIAAGSLANGPAVWLSDDGLRWTWIPGPWSHTTAKLVDVAAGDAGWLITARNDEHRSVVMVSADGVRWSSQVLADGRAIWAGAAGPTAAVGADRWLVYDNNRLWLGTPSDALTPDR